MLPTYNRHDGIARRRCELHSGKSSGLSRTIDQNSTRTLGGGGGHSLDGGGSLGGGTEQSQVLEGDAGGNVGSELAVSAVLDGAGGTKGDGIAGGNAGRVGR